MKKLLNLAGQKFGRLNVLECEQRATRCGVGGKPQPTKWKCRCDCGQIRSVRTQHLRSGATRSCGCLQRETVGNRDTTHGLSHTPEYGVWSQIIQRCTNSNHKRFADYGGRGVTIAPEWINFKKFYDDMGARPTLKHSIERVDNNLGYCKSNCKWVLPEVQNNNTRRNCLVVLHGMERTVTEWCKELNLNYRTVKARLTLYGWSVERAFWTPTTSGFRGTN